VLLIGLLVLTATACGSGPQSTTPTVPAAIDTIVTQRPWVAPMVAALQRQDLAAADDVDKIIEITTFFETACMMRRSTNKGVTWDAASLRAELATKNVAIIDDEQATKLSLAYEVMCRQQPMTLPT
jgi:hypothetical protein